MTCQEFLEKHTEYRDDMLGEREAELCRVHLETCASCMRYDRVVQRGVQLLAQAPELQPSADLIRKVHQRTARLEREPRADGMTWAVGIAAALAIVAWSPMLRGLFDGDAARPAGVAVEAEPGVTAWPDVPPSAAVRFGYAPAPWVWQGVSTVADNEETLASGPYSPLIVDPPAYRAAPPPAGVAWTALHP